MLQQEQLEVTPGAIEVAAGGERMRSAGAGGLVQQLPRRLRDRDPRVQRDRRQLRRGGVHRARGSLQPGVDRLLRGQHPPGRKLLQRPRVGPGGELVERGVERAVGHPGPARGGPQRVAAEPRLLDRPPGGPNRASTGARSKHDPVRDRGAQSGGAVPAARRPSTEAASVRSIQTATGQPRVGVTRQHERAVEAARARAEGLDARQRLGGAAALDGRPRALAGAWVAAPDADAQAPGRAPRRARRRAAPAAPGPRAARPRSGARRRSARPTRRRGRRPGRARAPRPPADARGRRRH